MRIIKVTRQALKNYGLTATNQDIKRAYWRHCKQRNGFNIGLSNQTYKLTEYLKLNQIAKPIKTKKNESSI